MASIFRIKRFATPMEQQQKQQEIQAKQQKAANTQQNINIAQQNLQLRKQSNSIAQTNTMIRQQSNSLKQAKIASDQAKVNLQRKLQGLKGTLQAKAQSNKANAPKYVPGMKKLTTPVPPKSMKK